MIIFLHLTHSQTFPRRHSSAITHKTRNTKHKTQNTKHNRTNKSLKSPFYNISILQSTMGRITIFTGNDSNSKYALRELERRHLPYTEISVTSFPDRLHDLEALSDAPSVPQVFFNTRYVGGVDSLKKELRRWDRSKRYATPYEKYEAEIQCGFDPSNPRLAIPQGEPEVFSHARLSVLSPTTIQLPDGTMTSFRDITEKLRNSLPTVELRQKGVLHKHVFSGNMASQVFERIFEITHGEALTFGTTLMETGVIQPLKGKGKGMSEAAHYRLQCFHQPSVLNSYCHWRGQQATNNHSKLVVDLIRLLNDIDGSAINDRGLSDYSKALKNDLLPLFEESVCELQQVRLDEMQNKEKLAFAINVYCLLMRYAFYKVGIPLSESDRLHFLTNVKFNIGGTLYSFEDWSNALFGRQKKIKSHSMKVEGADARVHLAMNNGTMAGSTQSLPFTSFDADNIDQQLTVAAKVFMGDDRNFAINRRKGSVEMSNLFKYERNDFHGSTENHLIEGTLDYMTGKDKSDARGLLASNLLPKIKYTAPVLGRKTKNALWYEREALEVDQKGLRGMLNRFRPPKMHANERARLEALRSLNVLDTVEEERYDRIVRIIAVLSYCGISPVCSSFLFF